jgi:hypothetical protein
MAIVQNSPDVSIDEGFRLTVTGQQNAPFALFANGGAWLSNLQLDGQGSYSSPTTYTWVGHTSADSLGVRYDNGHRYGPTIDIPFQAEGAAQTQSVSSNRLQLQQSAGVAPAAQ